MLVPYQHHAHDKQFLKSLISNFPWRFRPFIAKKYSVEFIKVGRTKANLNLLRFNEKINDGIDCRINQGDSVNVERAKNLAYEMQMLYASIGYEALMQAASVHLKAEYFPEPPKDCEDEERYTAARLQCEKWWRRQLRKQQGRKIETLGRHVNLINVFNGLYASDETVKRRFQQKNRNRKILESLKVINEDEQEYTLQQLSDLSVSNPEIRRGELMTRIRGFENFAEKIGYVGEFWTITLPSRFHSCLSKTGKANKKFKGKTPREGQQQLARQWAQVRAKFKRMDLEVFGFRVSEPQHDGTPHWHMLLFMRPENVGLARYIYKDYALRDEGNERGAKKYRFKAVAMNRGGAAGYIAKYISKNIDGYGFDDDLFGGDVKDSARRVDAWASTWGIRQFQQIGGHSVTVWRELRRLKENQVDDEVMEHWRAADAGDWCAYLEAMNKRKLKTVTAWNDKLGQYGEPIGDQILGVGFDDAIIYVTRIHEWTLSNASDSALAWSTVNNCTEENAKNGEYKRE